MPTIAELNVRIGADLKALDRSMKSAESTLRRSASRLSAVATDLSQTFTVALGGFGLAALKSFADIEQLQKGLETQVGSAEKARKELDLIEKTAQKPGLGFEQFVNGSIALQSMGDSAGLARRTIAEFGNALALAGKGAAELDGVNTAITQIKAKGKVQAEEINQIAERLPQIRTLMQQAFGTASSEEIQKLGITADVFINGLVDQMSRLPRASDSFKNSLSNLFDTFKRFLANIGGDISNAFNLPALFNSFTETMATVSAGFSGMSDEAKKTVVQFSAVFVAAGPIAKVLAAVSGAGAQLVSIWRGLATAIGAAITAFTGVDAVLARLKLSLGVVGLIIGLTTAVYATADSFDAAEFAASKYEEAQKNIIDQTSQEIGYINQAFEALKDETKTRFEKGKIVDELQKQYPNYLRNIDLETASVEKLTDIQKGLNDQILRGVAERQKAIAVTALYEKQAQLLTRITQLRDGAKQTAAEATLVDTGDMIAAGGIAEAVIIKLQEQANALTGQIKVVEQQFDKTFGTIGGTMDIALQKEYEMRDAYLESMDAYEDRAAAAKKAQLEQALAAAAKKAMILKEVLSDIAKERDRQGLLGAKDIVEEAQAIENGMVKLLDAGFGPTSTAVLKLREEMKGLFSDIPDFSQIATLPTPGSVSSDSPKGLPKISTVTAGFKDSTVQIEGMSQAFAGLLANAGLTKNAIDAIGSGMQAAATASGEAVSGLVGSLIGLQGAYTNTGIAALIAASQILKAGLIAAASKAIENSVIYSKNPILGAALAAISVGAIAAIFDRVSQLASKTPKFFTGTYNAPGGLVSVGEFGQELVNLPKGSQVIPANKTRRMLSDFAGGAQNITVTGTLRAAGDELLALIQTAENKQRRAYG